MGSFAKAADAPSEEIAEARDDVRNTFQFAQSLYDALEWIYGPGAFGLRLAAWFARKAPDAAIYGMVLPVMRLRAGEGAILPSEKIAEMAKDAKAACDASKRLERLWREDARFKQVLGPKRIKAAFSDKIALKRWKEEIRRASMRKPD